MKKALVILGVICVLFFSLILIIPHFYKDEITAKVKSEINSKLNAHVEFDRLGVSLLKNFPNLTISFSNIKISDNSKFVGADLAKMKKLEVELNLWCILFHKETHIEGLNLEDPQINIFVNKDGLANYNIVKEDSLVSDTTSSVEFDLDDIMISNGRIIYDDHYLNTYIAMEELDYEGRINLTGDILDLLTKAKMKELTYDYDNVRYLHRKNSELDLSLEINLKNNTYSFKENKIRLNHFVFSLEGYFTMLEEGYKMDLNFTTKETSFKNILSLIPGVFMDDFNHIKAEGELGLNGSVKGIYSDSLDKIPSFNLNVKLKDGLFKVDTLPNAVKNIQLDFSLSNAYDKIDSTVVDLKRISALLGKNKVEGRFKLAGIHNYKIDTDLKAYLDLSQLKTVLPLKGLDVKGMADIDLSAKGQFISKGDLVQQIPVFHCNLKLVNGRVKYDSLPSAIDNIQLQVLANNSNGKKENTFIQVKNIHLNLDDNPVSGNFSFKGYDKYQIDGELKARLDLEDLGRVYPMEDLTLKGIFDLDMMAFGIYDKEKKKFPSINVSMNLDSGWLKSAKLPEPIENIHLVGKALNSSGLFKDTKFDISKLTYTMEGEPFEVSGSIKDMADPEFDLKVNGRVDLNKITQIYPVSDAILKGIIDSDFSSKGKLSDLEDGRYRRIKSEGKMAVNGFAYHSSNMPDINIQNASISFTPDKLNLENFAGKFGKSKVSMTGELSNYMAFLPKRKRKPGEQPSQNKKKPIIGDLILSCDTLDLDEWMVFLNSYEENSEDEEVLENDSIKEVKRKLFNRIDFKFDSKIAYTKYQDVNIYQLDGEIRIINGKIILTETGFNCLDAKFFLTGEYDPSIIDKYFFAFNVDVNDLDIERSYKEIKLFRDLVPAAENASGLFSVSYKLKGEVDEDWNFKSETLNGGGVVRIANAKINNMKIFDEISKTAKKNGIKDPHLKDLVMESEVAENKITIKPFSLKISGLDADIEGTSEMSGAIQYVFKIELLPINKLKIPFHITGTYDKPKVALGKGHFIAED